ncbi:MAG: biotin--[acetyl-CoA-carboxylase] ligase [Chitinophagaceae bacterium]
MRKKSIFGDHIIELNEIDSTNNYAMQLINEGMAENGMIIRADMQTHGKGQHGNNWISERRSNLLMSAIIEIEGLSIEKQFLFNAFTSVAIAEMLMQQYDMKEVSIKWPNDIYADKQKIAGILIENSIRGNQWTHAIIGIGLNINQKGFEDMNRATSMYMKTKQLYKVSQVMKVLIKYLNQSFQLLLQEPEQLLINFNQLLLYYEKEILYKKKYETYKGILQGVDEWGHLKITGDGKTHLFKHKEIELIIS